VETNYNADFSKHEIVWMNAISYALKECLSRAEIDPKGAVNRAAKVAKTVLDHYVVEFEGNENV
jgi:hypothetical protein